MTGEFGSSVAGSVAGELDEHLPGILAGEQVKERAAGVLAYGGGRQVQAGYHATEVKAGSFVTLDCGGGSSRQGPASISTW